MNHVQKQNFEKPQTKLLTSNAMAWRNPLLFSCFFTPALLTAEITTTAGPRPVIFSSDPGRGWSFSRSNLVVKLVARWCFFFHLPHKKIGEMIHDPIWRSHIFFGDGLVQPSRLSFDSFGFKWWVSMCWLQVIWCVCLFFPAPYKGIPFWWVFGIQHAASRSGVFSYVYTDYFWLYIVLPSSSSSLYGDL